MDSQEIVRTFLSKGFTLAPDSLDFFSKNPDSITSFLDKARLLQDKPKMLTMDIVGGIVGQVANSMSAQMLTSNGKQEPYTAEQMAQHFSDRYARLSKILSVRMDLVNLISINKISSKLKKFSIICMVGEKNAEMKTISAEDMSGSANVFFPDSLKEDFKFIVEDEVVGLVCTHLDNEVVAEKVVWPDIPLRIGVAKSDHNTEILAVSLQESYEKLLSWMEQNSLKDMNLIIFNSGIKQDGSFAKNIPKNWKVFSDSGIGGATMIKNPTTITVDGVKIFAVNGNHLDKYMAEFSSDTISTTVALLKKRHMNPKFEYSGKILGGDPMLLSEVPDIILVAESDSPGATNYKGTTIVANGRSTKPIYHIVNLRTRETIKIDLT